MSSKETWKWTKYSPERFKLLFREAPTLSGKLSTRKRKCYLLGVVGTLSSEPHRQESFFRILRGESGGGLFFVERITKKENGDTNIITESIKFSMIPDEIKNRITVIKEGTKCRKNNRIVIGNL